MAQIRAKFRAALHEAVLEANHGLADYGPTLPPGLKVTMPDIPTAAPERQIVNLWD
ncbi:TPA: tail protein X [Pseudomonas aeruginosa]|nr:tail protein X [Pseudomonas aeruginosa]